MTLWGRVVGWIMVGETVLSLHQDPGAGSIDWGDGPEAPAEIEVVDAGTDCKNLCLLLILLVLAAV